jgi:sugar diacid utilization regulator
MIINFRLETHSEFDVRYVYMNISLNIILDSISHYRYELHISLPTSLSFCRISPLPREISAVKPDCLYICKLSEVMRVKEQAPEFYCICLRDRIRDDLETADKLKNTIIINENVELVALFSELQETFLRINDWYQEMQNAIINKRSIQDIITMSEPILGNFISVTDSALSLLAYTKNIPTDDPVSVFLIKNGYHSEKMVRKFKQFGRFDVWKKSSGLVIDTSKAISKYTAISKVFTFNDVYYTHVVMTTTHREMTPGLLDLFTYMVDVLKHNVIQNWEKEKNYSHIYNTLVADLMEGNLTERELVEERARIVGFKPNSQYVVMIPAVGREREYFFPGRVARDLTHLFPSIVPVYYNCRLILLLHHIDIAHLIEDQDMESKLNAYFRDNNIFCGVSDIFDDLLELPNAYQQAVLTLKQLKMCSQNGKIIWDRESKLSNIAHFRNYYAGCLIDRSEQSEKFWKSSRYGKMLIELYESDLEKNTNNLEVLYAYLINERRASETAAQLHMHRNNVVYRISRIENMLNLRLEDKLTRINLMMSFLMLRNSGFLRGYKNQEQQT